ncbi:hypothetical protein LSH36_690g04040 [Paralvinella palmiformis]|uniref:BTB domain-containing protein n=1 Tax=Paralvinella palmiformis TaxID=53620 RepID=A0AAD9J3G4_9ANNE|nr:hypothetical protein LSH36_690g04040 [Paralvinella palmiformis]
MSDPKTGRRKVKCSDVTWAGSTQSSYRYQMMRPQNCDQNHDSFRFQCSDHCWTVLKGLETLRHNELLFDVTLVVEGHEFPVHRVVMASCSDYFRAMFTDAMLEKHQDVICLNGVSAIGVGLLIEYAYTSRLDLDHGNVQDVLGAASHLQIQPLVEACSRYLEHHLDLENCVDILNIADTYSLAHLQQVVYCYMGQNLDKLACLLEFQNVSGTQLRYFLRGDFPINCPEIEVLQAIISWLQFDPARRVAEAAATLDCVHYHDIQCSELRKLLKMPVCKELARRYPHVVRTLRAKAYRCGKANARRCHRRRDEVSCLVNPRGFEKAIVNAGGFQAHKGLTNELTYLHLSTGRWRKLTSIPHVEQCDFGIAVLDNELYVVGGCFNQSLQEHIHPFGFKYDPRADKWTTIAPMCQERCRFYLGVAGGFLYALGGVGEQEGVMECSCEKYDPRTDFWLPAAALPSPRMQHAGADYLDVIYISGGLDMLDRTYDDLIVYDGGQNGWETRAGLLVPRADHCMTAHGDRLYVAGGWYEDLAGNRVIVDVIDCYCCLTDQWHHLTQLPTPRYHASTTVINDVLYVIGGFGAGQYNRASRKIETYDLETSQWVEHDEYPVEIWEHVSCKLYVPVCRSDKGNVMEFDQYGQGAALSP